MARFSSIDDGMIDLFQVEGFLDSETVAEIVAELERAGRAQATVLGMQPGGVVQPRVRKVTRVPAAPKTGELVQRRLIDRKAELGAHFGVDLTMCEDPQFLRYEPGDFFVAHQDGNTPLVYDESRFRRISAVVFLSRPSDTPSPGAYGGGELVFHGSYNRRPQERMAVPSATQGTLVAFRSETTHEVTIVTHGVRYSIASWYR